MLGQLPDIFFIGAHLDYLITDPTLMGQETLVEEARSICEDATYQDFHRTHFDISTGGEIFLNAGHWVTVSISTDANYVTGTLLLRPYSNMTIRFIG